MRGARRSRGQGTKATAGLGEADALPPHNERDHVAVRPAAEAVEVAVALVHQEARLAIGMERAAPDEAVPPGRPQLDAARREHVAQAVVSLQRAVELQPNAPELRDNLGLARPPSRYATPRTGL